jgi:protein-disulfide isomerase
MHPNAESAAETAEFAGAKGKFWEMHDLLFENQNRLGGPLYLALAKELGLSPASLRQALEAQEYAGRVRADFKGGVRSGVNGTPTFFVNGRRHDGPFDFDDLARAIEEAIGAVGLMEFQS